MRKNTKQIYRIATSNLAVSRAIFYSTVIVALFLLDNIISVASVGHSTVWTPVLMTLQTIYVAFGVIIVSEYKPLNPVLEKMRIK